MITEGRRSFTAALSWVAALCFVLVDLLVGGCGPRPSSEWAETIPSSPSPSETVAGMFLRAEPNPVPSGKDMGKTMISWQTGSETVADIFYVNGQEETLFATGAKGSKEAAFIRPGPNEFRLYNQGQRKLVTKLIVNMPVPASPTGNTSATPTVSTSQ
jgi:hypothetical protein